MTQLLGILASVLQDIPATLAKSTSMTVNPLLVSMGSALMERIHLHVNAIQVSQIFFYSILVLIRNWLKVTWECYVNTNSTSVSRILASTAVFAKT